MVSATCSCAAGMPHCSRKAELIDAGKRSGVVGKTSGTLATDREQRVEDVSKEGEVIDIAGRCSSRRRRE